MIKVQHELIKKPWSTALSHSSTVYTVHFILGNEQHDDYVLLLEGTKNTVLSYEFDVKDKFKALRKLVQLKHEIITEYLQRNNIGFINY